MPRCLGKVCSRFAYRTTGFGQVVDLADGGGSSPVNLFAPRVLLPGGVAEGFGDGDAGSLTVVRGAKGKYCFTLGRPVAVELEDVPEEVMSVLLAPAFLYELLVEGSSSTEAPHAVRFARRLAQIRSMVARLLGC